MRITNQVSMYCMFRENERNFFILVKRNEKRGGFWQPLTGGEEDFDNGDLMQSAIREAKEEINLDINKDQIIKIPYSFKFTDKQGIEYTEYCFGLLLSIDQKTKIKLSDEHTAIIFSEDIQYLKSLLKFEENRIGLEQFYNQCLKINYITNGQPLNCQNH